MFLLTLLLIILIVLKYVLYFYKFAFYDEIFLIVKTFLIYKEKKKHILVSEFHNLSLK